MPGGPCRVQTNEILMENTHQYQWIEYVHWVVSRAVEQLELFWQVVLAANISCYTCVTMRLHDISRCLMNSHCTIHTH